MCVCDSDPGITESILYHLVHNDMVSNMQTKTVIIMWTFICLVNSHQPQNSHQNSLPVFYYYKLFTLSHCSSLLLLLHKSFQLSFFFTWHVLFPFLKHPHVICFSLGVRLFCNGAFLNIIHFSPFFIIV